MFLRTSDHVGPSIFHTSIDRGKSWNGPYLFPELDTPGMVTRTDYLVLGPQDMLVFLSVGKPSGLEGRVACARTTDGGKTWKRLSWVGPEPAPDKGHFIIMPATVKLGPEKLLTVVRHREGQQFGLSVYASEDLGHSWTHLPTPQLGNLPGQNGEPIHNPPALIQLTDGRLCLAYGVRETPARLYVRFSGDQGRSWGKAWILNGGIDTGKDMGYPRLCQRADGQVLALYYFNHALKETPSYRHILATVFDPAKIT